MPKWFKVLTRNNSAFLDSLLRYGSTVRNRRLSFNNQMLNNLMVGGVLYAKEAEFNKLKKSIVRLGDKNYKFYKNYFSLLEKDCQNYKKAVDNILNKKPGSRKDLISLLNLYFQETFAVISHLWPILAMEDQIQKKLEISLAKFINPEKNYQEFRKALAILLTSESSVLKNKPRSKKIVKNRQELIRRYNFDSQVKYWSELARKIPHWRLTRIVVVHESIKLLNKKWGKKICALIGLKNIEKAYWWEILDLLSGKISNPKFINQRGKDFSFLISGRDYKSLTKKQAKEILNDFVKSGDHKQNIIIGQIASLGLATGEVRIILGPQDFKKFHKGEILVTTMTMPDFVPLMKISKGIITDEGGISCHAAIISRELKKPCIIGTTIATQVLKNGNKVILDANKGIIKIIK